MHPLAARHKFTKEGGSLARASTTTDTVVLDITSSSGTNRLAVEVPQREAPHAVSSVHAGVLDLLPKDLGVGEHTASSFVEGLTHVSRTGADVNDALGAEVLGIQQGIGQNQDILVIRALHLNGLAIHRLDHVTWSEGVAANDVFAQRNKASDIDLKWD